MHTTHNPTVSSLPSLLPPVPSVPRSPYPVDRKPMAPLTPARRAYNQLKSMLSTFRPNQAAKNQKKMSVVDLCGDEGRALGGRLAPRHVNNTQTRRRAMLAPARVPGGQLAPGHPDIAHTEPSQETIRIDDFHGRAQVAKTSARFLSTLLDCPETLSSTDPTQVRPDLVRFIAVALDRSRVPLCVHQYAMHLIWRVKSLNPGFKPKHAHGTYLTALMLASKQSQDSVYSMDGWVFIGQDIFESSQLHDNEWRMCERLQWRFLVHPMDLIKLVWAVEVEHGELSEGAPLPSAPIARTKSEVGLSVMFTASVASSLSSLSSSPSSHGLDSPWSGWGDATPSGSSFSTPGSHGSVCDSSTPSPLVLA